MDCNELLNMEPFSLLEFLTNNYVYEVDTIAETSEDMQVVASIMANTYNEYSFLSQLLSLAKVQCRLLKRKGKDYKKEYEDTIDKRDIIDNILKVVKLRYQTLSRLITIKQEVNKELSMSEIHSKL